MGAIKPFAAGGVIGTPTYFPLTQGGVGLAGEAGPEAILPLARGAGRPARRRGSGAARRQRHHPYRDAGRGKLPPLRDLHHRPDRPRGGARPTEPLKFEHDLVRPAFARRSVALQ